MSSTPLIQVPRAFGPTGARVPPIGFGTWHLDESDSTAAVRAVQMALDLGLTHIDTAELYGSGLSESLVGEAIESRRDDVFLVSKIVPSNATRSGTIAHCEKSLKRLRTDRLDCYLIHWPGEHPIEDTVAALEQLVRAGKIRSWGVSNFDEQELENTLRVAGPNRIACNQVLYHLGERTIEHAVMPWCEKHGVAVVGYTPFGQATEFPPSGAQGAILSAIAKKHDATARQVTLAFLTRRPPLFTIPKAVNPEHIRDNAFAARVQLTDADLAAIDGAFPVGRRRHGVATL